MAIDYKAWLAATGKPPTEANALIWKKTHGVALGKYNPDGSPRTAAAPAPGPGPEAAAPAQPAPRPYTPPAFDPNYRDPQGQKLQSLADAKYDTTRANARLAYGTWLNQNFGEGAATFDPNTKQWTYDTSKRGGMFNRIADDERENMRTTLNAAAARGMVRSGNRIENEGKVAAAATNARTDLTNQQQNAFNAMNTAVSDADTQASYQIGVDSNLRNIEDYNRKHAMGQA